MTIDAVNVFKPEATPFKSQAVAEDFACHVIAATMGVAESRGEIRHSHRRALDSLVRSAPHPHQVYSKWRDILVVRSSSVAALLGPDDWWPLCCARHIAAKGLSSVGLDHKKYSVPKSVLRNFVTLRFVQS